MLQDRVPDICFATRHPVKDWDTIKDNPDLIPDLDRIMASGSKNKRNAPFPDEIRTTNDGNAI